MPIVNGTVAIVLSHMMAILPPAFVMSTAPARQKAPLFGGRRKGGYLRPFQ